MTKQEVKALRKPFINTLFKDNKFNLIMASIASFLQALSFLAISWVLKEVSDLIAGTSQYEISGGNTFKKNDKRRIVQQGCTNGKLLTFFSLLCITVTVL